MKHYNKNNKLHSRGKECFSNTIWWLLNTWQQNISCSPLSEIQYGDSWTRGSKTSAAVQYRKSRGFILITWSWNPDWSLFNWRCLSSWFGISNVFSLVGSTILWLLICCMLFAYVRYSDRLNFDSGKWFWFILHISVNFLS